MNTGDVGARPVFVLSLHRSRSTLLQRVLNCHPGLVVWGEHGGLVNKLAEMDRIASAFPFLTAPIEQRQLHRYVDKSLGTGDRFEPWVSPWDPAAFRDWCRAYLDQTFGAMLQSGQRWGFKEIRCNAPETTRFLAELYPLCRFVTLRRDLLEVCVSSLLCPWSLEALERTGAGETEAHAREAVADCCYAAAALDWQIARSEEVARERCFALGDAEIATRWRDMFAFLDLPVDPALEAAVGARLERTIGATPPDGRAGWIDRAFVEAVAPSALSHAIEAIASDGPDLARLRRTGTSGRHSYLMGDHELRETRFSSMFW